MASGGTKLGTGGLFVGRRRQRLGAKAAVRAGSGLLLRIVANEGAGARLHWLGDERRERECERKNERERERERVREEMRNERER